MLLQERDLGGLLMAATRRGNRGRQRIRAGYGYRRDARWRYELLYIWSRSRDTIGERFTTADDIVDVRVKRVF